MTISGIRTSERVSRDGVFCYISLWSNDVAGGSIVVSEDLLLATKAARPSMRRSNLRGRARRWLTILLTILLVMVVWEIAKAIFNIPDYKLPHVLTILGEFGAPTQGGTGPIWLVLMMQNAGATLIEALTGFVLGGLLGCALAVAFAASPLLERGLPPYVVGSQLVPILAIAPMVVIGM